MPITSNDTLISDLIKLRDANYIARNESVEFYRTSANGALSKTPQKYSAENFDYDNSESSLFTIPEKSWLSPFGKEDIFSYAQRLAISEAPDMAKKILSQMTGSYSSANHSPITGLPQSLNDYFFSNYFLGSNYKESLGMIFRELATTGHLFLYTDKAASGSPYSFIIPVENVLYSKYADGVIQEMSFCHSETIQENFILKSIDYITYIDSVHIYKIKNYDNSKWELVYDMPNVLGVVPCSYCESQSLVKGPGVLDWRYYNVLSWLYLLLMNSSIVIIQTPASAEKSWPKINGQKILKNNMIVPVNEGEAEIKIIGFPAGSVAGHENALAAIQAEYKRESPGLKTDVEQSGASKEMDWHDSESVIDTYHPLIVTLVIDSIIFRSKYMDVPLSPEPNYPKVDFDFPSIDELIKKAVDLRGLGVGTTYLTMSILDIVRADNPNLDEKTLKIIEAEIRAKSEALSGIPKDSSVKDLQE